MLFRLTNGLLHLRDTGVLPHHKSTKDMCQIIGVGGGGRGGNCPPPGFRNMLKFGQIGWDIRAFGRRKKLYNLKNDKNKKRSNDKLS